ncbi:Ig-like domain-containing protein [Cellulomonas sp. URHE0023]|uniref:Ig-like domain-containing protein n=1 Tax=Cellulomonas sp. URHE0023 TaxID=1380354 RepID=UPI0004831CE2|nr:Ig-like domain-containing protein [Cellulomonas sp. URHE0023]
MNVASLRQKATATAAVVVVPVLVAVLALVDQGFPLARLDLNDGAVWLTATSQSQLGRYNATVEELNGGLVADGTDFDVLQDEGDILLVEQGQVSVVDPASVTITTQVATPGATVRMAGGTVAVADADGNAWVRAIGDLDGLRIGTDAPDLELGSGGKVVVAQGGAVLGVAADDGAVTRVDLSGGSVQSSSVGTLGTGEVDQVTAVGDQPVTLSGSTVRTLHGAVEVPGDGLRLQQPGPASSVVLVASTTALIEVPLDGGDVVEHPTDGSGKPAEPVRVGACALGAWATGNGSYLELCDGAKAKVSDLEGMSSSDALAFRVNRQVVVLNDTLRGRLWLPLQDTDLRVPNWNEVVPQEDPEQTEDQSQSTDTTQELVTECSNESAPPTAADDAFGVRPGRATILPVVDNDSSSDCGILSISQFDQVPPEFGTVALIYGGRALQVQVAATAVGSAELTYTISDGRGTTAPSTGHVVLTVHDESTDAPPIQVRTGSLTVEQGGQADHQVLADFVDPDGDDLLLIGAVADPAAGSARFRQDGTLTFKADGPTLGRTRVTLQVSDGRTTTEGVLDVDVRPAGSMAPQIDPVFAVTYVDMPVTLHPLDSVRSSSSEPPRLAGVDEVVGATVSSDLQAGTFTFSAARAGSYYVPFLVTASPQQATGLARIDVKEWPETAEPPVAVRDRASLPAGGEVTIDPLDNDSDPAGKVLVLQSVEVPEGSGLRVAILDHHLVQIRSERTLTLPVVLRYSVSSGQSSAVGEIIVQPVPASTSSQPPVVPNVEVDVRTGGVVTIPVLDGAFDPDGDRPVLVPELAEPLGPGEGLLFVSGDVLRYQAPPNPLTARATFSVMDATGNVTAATVTVRVHESDAGTKAPPRPRDLTARVFEGDKVRIVVPLVGIDADGDGVTLLGIASSPSRGRVTAVGPDWLEYQALPDELDTDEFTYAVEDWTGQRAVAKIRVGISPRPTSAALVTARDDQVTVKPGQRVEVRVLANDVDSSGGELTLNPLLDMAPGTDAQPDGRRIIVHAPDAPTVLQIGYTVENSRGGRDTAVLTVTVAADARVLPPIARDVVVNALDTLGRTEVSVDVLAVAQNPSGPLSDLVVSVPGSLADVASVVGGKVVVTLVDHSQTVPFLLTNKTSTSAASYAFITVPALGFFPPTARPKAPELRVASGAQLVIPLDEQVQVAPGRTPTVADPAGLSATKSDRTSLLKDDRTLQFTSAPGYAGPASITVPVTDASGPADASARTAIITLQITVYAIDDHPPTFTPSTIDVAPGEAPLPVDLRSFTTGPEGDTEDPSKVRYSYQINSAVPAGFTATIENGSFLTVSAAETATKGRTEKLALKIGYGRSGSLDQSVDLRVIASTRRIAQVQDVQIEGVEGKESTVQVLENAYNPFSEPLTVVGATVETPGAGTASATSSSVSVRPAAGFIGQMVTRFRVRDVTGDPDREVEGRIYTVVRGKPATPTAPRIGEIRDKTVVLSWDAPDSRGAPILGYRVVANPGNIVRSCVSTTCTIDNLTNDTEYTFTVAAQNVVDWSDASLASAPARPDAVPGQPGMPVLEFGAASVRATWTAPVQTGSPITDYTVEISPTPPSGSASVSSATTSYTFSGLKNGTAYSVRVRAHNKAPDPGPWSDSSLPMVPAAAPDAPTVAASRSETGWFGAPQITVGWNLPDGHGDAVRGFEISVDDGTPVGLDAATLAYSFPATRGHTYRIGVRALNKAGSSPWGTALGETWSQPTAPTAPSSAPVLNGAPWGAGSVTLAWAPPTETGGVGVSIDHYEIQLDDAAPTAVAGTGTTIQNLVGGASVTYRVRAVNSRDLAGDWLDLPTVTPVTRPASPVVAVTTGGVDQVKVTYALGANGGAAIDGQQVSVNGGPWQDVAMGSALPATIDTTPPTHAVTVDYRVHNSQGWSEPGSSSAPVGLPSAPAAPVLRATVSADGTKATIAWDAPDSHHRRITAYRWTVTGDVEADGTLPEDKLTFDVAVTPGTTIHVEVQAQNSQGWGQPGVLDVSVPSP